jgi:hypothetical protein
MVPLSVQPSRLVVPIPAALPVTLRPVLRVSVPVTVNTALTVVVVPDTHMRAATHQTKRGAGARADRGVCTRNGQSALTDEHRSRRERAAGAVRQRQRGGRYTPITPHMHTECEDAAKPSQMKGERRLPVELNTATLTESALTPAAALPISEKIPAPDTAPTVWLAPFNTRSSSAPDGMAMALAVKTLLNPQQQRV